MILAWLAASLIPYPSAAPCTPAQMQEVTRTSDAPLRLACSVILAPGQSIPRPILLEGEVANGVVVDCEGGTIGRQDMTVSTGRPTVAIWSRKQVDGTWARPQNIALRNCTIIGNVRIFGMGSDGGFDDLRHSSRLEGHTARAQNAAPTGISLEKLTISGRGSIPLYIGSGVTRVTLSGSTLNGSTTATAIYLDAESGQNHITNNHILTRTGREMIAVDGSARNHITGNRFDLHGKPGIFLYRNCGERGVIRHQTPSDNVISGNSFTGASWLRPRLVLENARNGHRSYCRDDAGYPFGSSADDRDNATGNRIENNRR